MASNSEKYIQNSILQSGGKLNGRPQNTPTQYANRQTQYYSERTRKFVQQRTYLSSDFVQAEVQGLDLNDFYRYLSTYIRFSDITSQMASTTKQTDDIKMVLFKEPFIDYFPIGAKIQTMGNTWLCANPSNMSSVNVNAVVQRCNTAYGLYDYYGNIVYEPIVVEKPSMSANDNNTPHNLVLMDGYFNVICQLNEHTDSLGQNSRLILGKSAYHITGFTDFIQEFTGDYDSVHLLRFTIRIEEPTDLDDLQNHIANGKNYVFSADITGTDTIAVGDTTQLIPHFIKGTKDESHAVESTDEYPITWLWTSSNPEICSVSDEGVVTGILSGQATITATMAQNKAIQAVFEVSVEEAEKQNSVAFITTIPQMLEQWDEIEIQAGYYENGTLTNEPITWAFSGANKTSYRVTDKGNNTIEIYCVREDRNLLTVTASYGDYSVSADIKLETA